MIDSIDGAHRVAQRPQDEVARHQEEEIDERDQDRLDLLRLNVGHRFEQSRQPGRIAALGHGFS